VIPEEGKKKEPLKRKGREVLDTCTYVSLGNKKALRGRLRRDENAELKTFVRPT